MALSDHSFDLSSGASKTIYYRGYPLHDAVRVDFDSNNSSSTDVDVTVKTYEDDDPRAADDNSDYSSMDQVDQWTGKDVSSGDPSYGSLGFSRVVAVKINEQGNTNGCEGSISLHRSADVDEDKHAFINR